MDRRSFTYGVGVAFGAALLGPGARGALGSADGPRVVRVGVLGTG
jgi:hypothetical protein